MTKEKAGHRENVRPEVEATVQGTTSARDVASRLWPPPDPIHYAKRKVVPTVRAGDVGLRTAVELRTRVDDFLFSNLVRLHVLPTEAERLLVLIVANLNLAVRCYEDALGLMADARAENRNREHDRRLMEREARRG